MVLELLKSDHSGRSYMDLKKLFFSVKKKSFSDKVRDRSLSYEVLDATIRFVMFELCCILILAVNG